MGEAVIYSVALLPLWLADDSIAFEVGVRAFVVLAKSVVLLPTCWCLCIPITYRGDMDTASIILWALGVAGCTLVGPAE